MSHDLTRCCGKIEAFLKNTVYFHFRLYLKEFVAGAFEVILQLMTSLLKMVSAQP